MTVLLSFEEKTGDAGACAQSGHCPFKLFSAPESVVVKTIFPAVLCLVPNLTYLVSRARFEETSITLIELNSYSLNSNRLRCHTLSRKIVAMLTLLSSF